MMIRQLSPDDLDQYRQLRLSSIDESPASIAASYDEEAAVPREQLAQRLLPAPHQAIFGAFEPKHPRDGNPMTKFTHIAAAALAVLTLTAAHAGEVCTAVADAASGALLVARGDCTRRATPASTFKIAISLMGYDAGFLKDAHTPLLPFREGYVDWRANWKQDTDPSKWMTDSVVWYSQQVTRALGPQRFADYTRRFDYGNADVTGDASHDGLTLAWIGSSLKITPLEQLAFLRKLVRHELGVSEHAYAMTAELTRFKQVDGWDVHGKTGSAGGWGWYVGWASRGARTIVFAHQIDDDATPGDVPAGVRAREAFIAALPALLARPAQ